MNYLTFWTAVGAIASILTAIAAWIAVIKFDWMYFIYRRLRYCKRLSLKLVRDKENPDPVYAIIGKKKRRIANEMVLAALGYKQDDVSEISKEELDKYEEGRDIIF